MKNASYLVSFLILIAGMAGAASAQVKSQQKISMTEGGFTDFIEKHAEFGVSVENLGDLDGDGINDLGVGAHQDNDGAELAGAVWVIFLNADGTVKGEQKISALEGGFTGELGETAHFGNSFANLGDMNGDGFVEYAVGAAGDDDLINDAGAVWLLSLNPDGTVFNQIKISGTEGGFTGQLDMCDYFGRAVANLGDLDGDGMEDIAVGAYTDDDGGAVGDLDSNEGAVWILFMNPDLTVKSHQKISAIEGNFTGELDPVDNLGTEVAPLGDIDGDGLIEVAVGAGGDDDGGPERGAVWILTLNPDGTVAKHSKISNTEGGFTGVLENGDHFGVSVENLGDLDGDGLPEIAVGADFDGDGGGVFGRGAVWILYLNADGSVKSHQKISQTEGGFTGVLDEGDRFGIRVANMGDINGDGATDMVVGAIHDDDGSQGSSAERGAVWIIFGDFGLTESLDITLTPIGDPIVVPPEGGDFQYTMDIFNTTTESQTFDIWISIAGPNNINVTLGPTSRTLAAGEGLSQVMTQKVPGTAPPGSYTLTGNIGDFPITVDDADSFTWEKSATQGSGRILVENWDTNLNEIATSLDRAHDLPGAFVLEQNYPNPFNPSTQIQYALRESAHVRLSVFDLMGREVARLVDGIRAAGSYSLNWEAGDLPSGIYLYRMEAGGSTDMKSMVLLR